MSTHRRDLLAPLLLLVLLFLAPACGLVTGGGSVGGASPPSGSPSVSFIDVG